MLTFSRINHRSHVISFISFTPSSEQPCLYHLFALTLLFFGTVTSTSVFFLIFRYLLTFTSVLFPVFFVSSRHPFGAFSIFGFLFFAIMPLPLSFGGGSIFSSVFCALFLPHIQHTQCTVTKRCTHRSKRCTHLSTSPHTLCIAK